MSFVSSRARRWPALFALVALSSSLIAEPQLLDGIAAIVDDDVVLVSELREQMDTVKRGMAQRGSPPPPTDALRREVLERMVEDSLQMQMARRAGVKVSDTEINEEIGRVAAARGIGLERLREELDAIRPGGYLIAREQLWRDLIVQRVQRGALRRRLRITEQEIDNLFASEEGQRLGQRQYHALHIRVLSDDESASGLARANRHAKELHRALRAGAPSDALPLPEAGLHVEQTELGWRAVDDLPALLADAMQDAGKGDWVGPLSSPGGSHILRVLDVRGGEAFVDQYKTRHILLEVSAIRSASQARDALRQFRRRIADGEDFAALARCCSDDHGTAREGGDLGWAGSGDVVEAFEEVMRQIPLGEISEPFETRFGWHVLTVEAQRRQDVTEERRRSAAYRWLYERRYREALDGWLAELRESAYVSIK